MAYDLITYRYPDKNNPKYIEYEFHYAGNYGARGERRAKKQKRTPEAVKKQNQKLRERKVARLLRCNFREHDYWITIKYSKGTRKAPGEVVKDIRRFFDKLRRRYKRENEELKYIYRVEIGKKGGIHIHMVLPRIRDGDIAISECWDCGRVGYDSLYERGGYEDLAAYLVKPPPEEQEKQLSLFEETERKLFVKYSCSRNLIRPEPERKRYERWTVKKLVESGPKASPGYYIDKQSLHRGINQFTGTTYYRYTEVRIKAPPERTRDDTGG